MEATYKKGLLIPFDEPNKANNKFPATVTNRQ